MVLRTPIEFLGEDGCVIPELSGEMWVTVEFDDHGFPMIRGDGYMAKANGDITITLIRLPQLKVEMEVRVT